MSQAGPSAAGMDRVALEALTRVRDGMSLGLGTGRAAEAFIRRLAERVKEGMTVQCVTTSNRSQALAESLAIPLTTLAQLSHLDIAFDGADEVTPELQLTKGLGGALLRERVVAHIARHFVVLITPEKRVDKLGSRTHIPIEVVPFARDVVERELQALGGQVIYRSAADSDASYLTDNGNLIADTRFAPLDAPAAIDQAIRAIPGVVDTGLFLNMAHEVLVSAGDEVEILSRPATA